MTTFHPKERQFFDRKIQEQIDSDRKQCAERGYDFKERQPGGHLIKDLVGAVLAIDNPEEAQRFYRGYVHWLTRQPNLTEPAERIADSNIGWCFGEGMTGERQLMWQEATSAADPIFG